MSELTEAEREALAGLAEALSCSQCGFPFSHRACGFTHAIVGHDPRQHRLIAPLLAAREEAAHAAGVAEGLRVAAERALADDDECPEDEAAGHYMAVRFGGDTGRSGDWAEAFRVARLTKRPKQHAEYLRGVAEGRALRERIEALAAGWESWGGHASQECAAMLRAALADTSPQGEGAGQ